MLVAAALIPPTALLVPGASGATPVLGVERAAAVAAATGVRAARPEVVVVVAPGRSPGRHAVGRLRPSLGAVGLDDARLGWPPRPSHGRGPAVVVDDPSAAVGLLLLDRAGWTGPAEVVTLTDVDPVALGTLGADLVRGRNAALLLVGGLSARRGPDGPLERDERAALFDDAAVSDLVDLGPAARARLAAVPRDLAVQLDVSAWAPWQVLLGAVAASDEPTAAGTDDPASDRVPEVAPAGVTPPTPAASGRAPAVVRHHVSAPFGATYASISWRWR